MDLIYFVNPSGLFLVIAIVMIAIVVCKVIIVAIVIILATVIIMVGSFSSSQIPLCFAVCILLMEYILSKLTECVLSSRVCLCRVLQI